MTWTEDRENRKNSIDYKEGRVKLNGKRSHSITYLPQSFTEDNRVADTDVEVSGSHTEIKIESRD